MNIFVACLAFTLSSTAVAGVWHCSKHTVLSLDAPPTNERHLTVDPQSFELANISFKTIHVSIDDLDRLYSGKSVKVEEQQLTGCFLKGGTVRQTKGNIIVVAQEKDMLECIANNFPAVGYLNSEIETLDVAPCF